MRVLVILTEVADYGGTSRFLERLLEMHAQRGIETVLLTPEGERPASLAALVRKYRVDLLHSPSRTLPGTPPMLTPVFDFMFSWRVVRSCRPDLVLVSTADPGRMSVAFYFPSPALYVLHSLPESRFRLLPRWYLRLGANLGNRVLTVSDAAAGIISARMGIPRTRISVLHNSCRYVAPVECFVKEALIVTAGHVVGYKNPVIWLEAARLVLRQYPEARFAWLGDGPLLDELRRRVKELSLEGRLLLPGYVPDPSPWYARAAIYLQPSLMESHGIAVLEAMAHGLPCVVSDAGGLPESVLDGDTGYLCPPGDAPCFARRLSQLMEDPALRTRMGQAGALRAETCFSEAAQEQKLMDVYQRLLPGWGSDD